MSVIMTRGGVTADSGERLHEPLRCRGVPSSLDQNLENEAVLVDCAPQPMCLTRDRDDDFIQMPFVAASRRTLADRVSEGLAEFLPPLAHRLAWHANSARSQPFLDHPQAQGKPEIQPDGMADNLRRKAMAAIDTVTRAGHRPPLTPRCFASC